MTEFRKQVYDIVAGIPKGKVATYSQVAEMAGSPGAARAVGTAMKNNPDLDRVPCHRVVGSDGAMHGYAAGGAEVKKEKLKQEGVEFSGGTVELDKSQWQR